ncbi:MAG: ComEC/Rec2 family competence protein [Gemmataceae bacterium]
MVLALNPSDPFAQGCQLSFLSVFVLVFGASQWLGPRPLTPVEQLIEESRGPTEKLLRVLLRIVWVAFAISGVLGIVNAPLILAWQNLASPVGILLGPPLVFLTSIALVAGFLLLLVTPLGIGWPFARLTELSLRMCEFLVQTAQGLPGGWVYSPAPSMCWLIGFYSGVVGLVLLPMPWARRCLLGLLVWTFAGLVYRATANLRRMPVHLSRGGSRLLCGHRNP